MGTTRKIIFHIFHTVLGVILSQTHVTQTIKRSVCIVIEYCNYKWGEKKVEQACSVRKKELSSKESSPLNLASCGSLLLVKPRVCDWPFRDKSKERGTLTE